MSANVEPLSNLGEIVDPDPWPELIPLGQPELPSLDPELLPPSWLRDFAAALARATETPAELPISMTLAVTATACARRLVVEGAPGYREPTNLWFCTALDPGNRKSSVESQAKAPLLAWEDAEAKRLAPKIAEARSKRKSAEARAKSLRAAIARVSTRPRDAERYAKELAEIERAMIEVPSAPRLWTSDATPERLGTLLAEHDECMSVLSSEGGIFDVLAGRYSKGVPNLDLVLKAHAGDADRVDRLSRDAVMLRFPRLTMGLSPQPDVLAGLADQPGFAGRGLLARFSWLLPASPLGNRSHDGPPVPAAVSDRYAAGIGAMLEWPAPVPGECHVLRLEDGASAELVDYRDTVERLMRPGEALEHHKGWAGKAPGAALRLAAVLHGVEHAHGEPWAHRIGVATMSAALDLLAVIQTHSVAALADMGEDDGQRRARRVLDCLVRRRATGCTVRDVHVWLRSMFRRAAEVRTVLGLLEEHGYVRLIEPEPSGERGRPGSPIVQVRPGLWS